MDRIKSYSYLYPGDRVTVVGGFAAYIWIKNKLEKEIEYRDIGILINTNEPDNVVIERWSNLYTTYQVVYNNNSIVRFKSIVKDNCDYPPIDLFINKDAYTNTVVIDGYNVPNLRWLIEHHEQTIRGMNENLDRLAYEGRMDQYDFYVKKQQRMDERYQLLLQISI